MIYYTREKGDKLIKFNKNVPLVIYGCGNIGIEKYRLLKSKNFNVISFIDRNKDLSKNEYSIPVWTLDHENSIADQCIVLITVRSIIQHEHIIDKLLHLGYKYFICIPSKVYFLKSEINILQRIYNNFVDNDFEKIKFVPEAREQTFKLSESSEHILLEYDDEIVFNAPIESVYSIERSKAFSERSNSASVYNIEDKTAFVETQNIFERCVLSIKPYIDLFKCFKDGGQIPEIYYSLLTHTSRTDKKTRLVELKKLYQLFCEEFEKGMEFFISSAPACSLGSRGRFFLSDGLHRTSFLVSFGLNKVPVRIKKQEYIRYFNETTAAGIFDYINEHRLQLRYTIPHPAFSCFRAERFSEPNPVFEFLLHIYPFNVQGWTILDALESNGYISRVMYQMGADKIIATCNSDTENFFLEQLNSFLKCNEITLINKFDLLEDIKFDCIFIEDTSSIFEKFVNISAKYLIIESLSENTSKTIERIELLGYKEPFKLNQIFREDGDYNILLFQK